MIRMSAGQLRSSSPPTEARSSPVSSTTPASSRSRGSPSRSDTCCRVRSGDLRDRGAGAGVEVEPDRVMHPASRGGVQRCDVADQVQGGARAVDGDQQVTAALGRNLRDGLGQHRDVVAGGVRPGPARSEQERQRLPRCCHTMPSTGDDRRSP